MDGGLDGAILPLNQAIGPRMLCADEAVVDSIGLHLLVELPVVLTATIGSDHAGQAKVARGVLMEPRGCVMRSESRYAPYLPVSSSNRYSAKDLHAKGGGPTALEGTWGASSAGSIRS